MGEREGGREVGMREKVINKLWRRFEIIIMYEIALQCILMKTANNDADDNRNNNNNNNNSDYVEWNNNANG